MFGLIVRADRTGLGYQTKAYYDHLKPDKTLYINSQGFNGREVEQHSEWYENYIESFGFPSSRKIVEFLDGLDVVLTAETPYNYDFYKIARAMGVKTICVPNWEFFDYYKYPHLPKPDMLLLPSVWHIKELRDWGDTNNVRVEYLHLPIDRSVFKYQKRTRGVPIHLAGKPATEDRNGTWTYLSAFIDGKITTQDKKFAQKIATRHPHAKIYTDIKDPTTIYQMGDILVLPRRYGGNCLPLNEALSTGMPVVMPDIQPNNYILPENWLVEAKRTGYFTPRTNVDLYDVNIDKLRRRVQWVKENIEQQSELANKIADTISWKTLKPKYIEVLNSL